MFYPILTDCETQPLVPITNLTLRNISSTDGWLPPGIIRCNETNPCTGFVFDNVNVTGWFNDYNLGYVTENVYGTSINSYPDPGFLKPGQPTRQHKWNSDLANSILRFIMSMLFDNQDKINHEDLNNSD
jgi:hypothetical protein